MVIPEKQSPRPSLSCLRFDPSSAQILFPGEVGEEVSFTMGRLAAPFPPPFGEGFGPYDLAFAPWMSASLALDLAEFGSGFFAPIRIVSEFAGS